MSNIAQLGRLKRSLCFIGLSLFSTLAFAKPAPSRTVDVSVVNQCKTPIVFQIDNNWGSSQSGDHSIPAAGSRNEQDHRTDRLGFFFNSNNDEEYYTISYKGSTCKVDYPMIRDYYFLDVFISGCDSTPKCSFKPF